ncbi:piggyBac transposable element-derived protein 1-like [Anastrepha ludens]|uniref:piggyBac transposable element-derived protein 1-like n=1 Tax=Anastrepha ludens TaxID=28586 RepID=UPI0023B07A7D|nr:piggyBac transposable element-derived protein 1-like [Anastrepha ludens]
MSKRKFLSDTELEKILAIPTSEEDEDYSSDDSVKDPVYNPTVYSSESEEDEEVINNIEEVLESLALEENREESDEEQENRVAGEPQIINPVWSEYEGRHKTFTFSGKSGLQVDVPQSVTPFDVFRLFTDDEIINPIVLETNRYAEQQLIAKELKRESGMKKWTPTNSDEMKKFLGLVLWMGLVRCGSIPSHWSTSEIYKNNVAPKVMPRNRFELILANIHFANNETIPKGDRTGKVQPLIDMLQKNTKHFIPS